MRRRLQGLVVVLAVGLVGCGDDDAASTTAVTTIPTTTTETTVTTTTVATTTTVLPEPYSQLELDYFSQVALGAEFGGASPTVRKWTQDVRIGVHGNPSEADLATLADVVEDLNALINTIDIVIVESGENVELHFAPESEFGSIEPNYQPVNMGFFWVWWEGAGSLTNARVLISTTGVTQAERSHLIREEVSQSLGLMNDSFSYEDSMFYQGWTETGAYSELDETIIEMLYLQQIEPGMNFDAALAVLADE